MIERRKRMPVNGWFRRTGALNMSAAWPTGGKADRRKRHETEIPL